ncbi:MAG: phosphonate ABC transporter, permease protein PhnE [Burkholderiaceae bacterium]|nr:phosphonate ABC transporter, permease protein PhnE [Burkholderiaceae bacterium]
MSTTADPSRAGSASAGRTAAKSYPEVWRRHTPREMLLQWLWLAGTALAAIWSVSALDIEWAFMKDAHLQAMDLAERMWPPKWSYLPTIVQPMIDTIHIATLGTAIAVALALPVAFLAARNTTANGVSWAIGRAILVGSRSINTVIWGLLFVAIFGPGPVAGIFAVAARSVGFIAKLIAEAIEEVDAGQIEAVRSTGAGTLQTWWVAIMPQILPVLVGTSIYRWDINVRESSVLGFVGAGGIGLYLYASINSFAWTQVIVVLIALLVIVMLSEALSAHVRGRIS